MTEKKIWNVNSKKNKDNYITFSQTRCLSREYHSVSGIPLCKSKVPWSSTDSLLNKTVSFVNYHLSEFNGSAQISESDDFWS